MLRREDAGLKAISNYWVEQAGGSIHDNGDDNIQSVMAGILADKLNNPVSDDEFERFRNTLEEEVIVQKPRSIRTDYAPERFLSSVCRKAEFKHCGNFPWKTIMHVEYDDDGIVKVQLAEGYGASYETIYER